MDNLIASISLSEAVAVKFRHAERAKNTDLGPRITRFALASVHDGFGSENCIVF